VVDLPEGAGADEAADAEVASIVVGGDDLWDRFELAGVRPAAPVTPAMRSRRVDRGWIVASVVVVTGGEVAADHGGWAAAARKDRAIDP
jgi:hypothetical protein